MTDKEKIQDAVTVTDDQESEIRKARAAYARQWRAKNPEANKQAIRRYWARRIEREGAANGK